MSPQRIKIYIKDNLLLILMFIIVAVVECTAIFPLMTKNYLNYDSSYQYALTQHSLPEIWELIPLDYSPPFYAITLKLFTIVFGNSLTTMRAFSLFAVIGMYFIAAFPMKELFGKESAYICLVLTFSATTILNTLHEIRPTIFAMFFFMALCVYAAGAFFLEKKHCYICMIVFSVLAMYTHYIALVGTFGVCVVLLVFSLLEKNYEKLKKFLFSGIICAVLYIPWLSVVLGQISSVNDNYWTSTYHLSDSIRWIFKSIFDTSSIYGTFIPFFLRLSLVFILLKHVKLKEVKNAKKITDVITLAEEKNVYKAILLLLLLIFVPVLILGGVNHFLRNLASHRYYYILGTAWIVILSAILGKFGNKVYSIVLAATFLFNNAINVNYIKKDLDISTMNDIVTDINEREPDGDIVFLHMHEYTIGLMAYYFPNAKHYVCDQTFTVLRSYDVFPVEIIDIGDYKNIWDYTDKCYIFTNNWKFNNTLDVYVTDELLEEAGNAEITNIDYYHMAYSVAAKDIDLAEAVYTGDKTDR